MGIYNVSLENLELQLNAADYNLPLNLYEYRDDIRLRIMYVKDTNEILECKVLNYMTEEIIEDAE